MKKEVIQLGPGSADASYSPAIRVNGFLFVSGQGPEDEQGRLYPGLSFEEQMHMAMKNIGKVLQAAGSSFDQMVQCRIYLSDIGNFDRMNKVYRGYFKDSLPVRTTVEAKLCEGIAVEIDCMAVG